MRFLLIYGNLFINRMMWTTQKTTEYVHTDVKMCSCTSGLEDKFRIMNIVETLTLLSFPHPPAYLLLLLFLIPVSFPLRRVLSSPLALS